MTEIKLNTYARVAGLVYIIVILLGVFSVSVVESSLTVPDNGAATYANISGNEFLFRISVGNKTYEKINKSFGEYERTGCVCLLIDWLLKLKGVDI